MRIFVTGASGWIGSAVTDELLTHGHEVVGLARSDAAADTLAAKGATAHRGSLDDLDSLAAAAASADGVVHLAFKHDFTDYAGAGRSENAAVQRMLDTLAGSDRPFLLASGLASGGIGRPLTEDDESPFHGADSMRGGSENLALSYAERGVRSVALRFSPTVHGMGDHGFTSVLTQVAKEHGAAGYVGDGSTRWAAVHRSDAARMVGLALEKAPAGSRMHAVAESGIPSRDIATAIGDYLNVPAVSVAPEDAQAHFGWIGGFFGMDITASNDRTRELLGWTPTGPTLLEDIAAGAYALPS
ncbi:nucleoside-diphosphate-sugar epimerase [Nocardia transvalensis]|uniref:Nucleoside-diphosphate-sugar epimerase n=1 Tax=Nocardia transvalensis TaxID=37333 RepID=A0A7W9PK73_9NOCA|nr:SDR family oxidoreductase [Nocardia transvalensis]MBB5917677.1 nucleoside-diphosphate-sugar epimerase [Nocardia transvalensis]